MSLFAKVGLAVAAEGESRLHRADAAYSAQWRLPEGALWLSLI